jgi:hypothetical protein
LFFCLFFIDDCVHVGRLVWKSSATKSRSRSVFWVCIRQHRIENGVLCACSYTRP